MYFTALESNKSHAASFKPKVLAMNAEFIFCSILPIALYFAMLRKIRSGIYNAQTTLLDLGPTVILYHTIYRS